MEQPQRVDDDNRLVQPEQPRGQGRRQIFLLRMRQHDFSLADGAPIDQAVDRIEADQFAHETLEQAPAPPGAERDGVAESLQMAEPPWRRIPRSAGLEPFGVGFAVEVGRKQNENFGHATKPHSHEQYLIHYHPAFKVVN